MSHHESRNVIVAVLVLTLLLTGAYALLSTTITISGTAKGTASFKITFDSFTVSNPDKATVLLGGNNDSMNITANLTAPGDTVTIDFVIKNIGTLAALVDSLTVNNNDNSDIVVQINGLNDIQGTVLGVGATTTGSIVITWNATSTIENPTDANFDVTINYLQAT